MNELSTTNSMTALASIERRINYHIQGAYANIVEVGRCLIEAKETGVVPHGQFEEWAERVTGLKKRNYQRLMQVAREVSPDSAMAKLPITKITAILSLPETQREEVAEKAVEENQSLRELQATIEAMKSSLDEARQTEARLTRERDSALAINERIYRERAEATKERDALKVDLERAKARPGTGISAKAKAEINQLESKLGQERQKRDSLEIMNAELADQCDRLSAQLADAEKMAEYQAQQREKAQQELLDLRTQAARGEGPAQEDLTAEAVGMAARTFIGTVGYVPHSDKLVTMREGDRQQIATYAAMLQHWAEEVLKAVSSARDTVIIEGV